MGLDITFSKNDAVPPQEMWQGTEILYFRKRYDIFTSTLKTEGYSDDEIEVASVCHGEIKMDRKAIEEVANKHEELKPLLEYQEVICWWCG